MQDQKRFGENVRNQRKAKGWSQDVFADRSGLHRADVGAIERGERNVTLRNNADYRGYTGRKDCGSDYRIFSIGWLRCPLRDNLFQELLTRWNVKIVGFDRLWSCPLAGFTPSTIAFSDCLNVTEVTSERWSRSSVSSIDLHRIRNRTDFNRYEVQRGSRVGRGDVHDHHRARYLDWSSCGD